MPFGLRNAAQTFQRFLDSIFCGLDSVFAYADDILIASTTQEEYLTHVEEVFRRLYHNGLVINESKYCFGSSSVQYLEHFIFSKGC